MKFGLMIVMVALMGSIIAGSIAVETGTHEETAYNHLTDLTPIVTSEPVDSSIQYNPIRNVTGWTGVNYQTQSNPSIYAIQTGQTQSTITSSQLGNMGGVYYAADAAYGYDGGYAYGGDYPYIVWSDMPTGTDPTDEQWPLMGWNPRYDSNGRSLMIGGYTQSWEQTGYRVDSVVTVGVRQGDQGLITWGTSESNPYYWQDLNRAAAAQGWNTGTVAHVSRENSSGGPTGIAQYISTTFDGSYLKAITTYDSYGRSYTTWRTEATLILNIYWLAEADYWWDKNTATFHLITGTDAQGLPQIAAETTPLVWISHSLTDTLDLTQWLRSNTTYVKPNTDVTINGNVASWSNGFQNDRVQMLVSPEAMIGIGNTPAAFQLPLSAQGYDMALVTFDKDPTQSYWQGVITYEDPARYTALSYMRPLFDTNDSGTIELTLTPDSITNYTGAYLSGSSLSITMSGFGAGSFHVSGSGATLSGNVVTIADLEESVVIGYGSVVQGHFIPTVEFFIVPIQAGPISALTVSTGTSTDPIHMAIVNTWVPADPNGLLWQNPSMDIGSYFGDLISTSGLRVTFGSVLSTGTAMNICGNVYQTGDGMILIDEGLYPINGLSIDIKDSDVTIYSDSMRVTSFTASTYTISGEGVWVWSAALYEQLLKIVEDVNVHFGEGSSKNWMIFAFLGLTILGIVAFAAWGRQSMDIWDWVVLAAAMIFGFVVI